MKTLLQTLSAIALIMLIGLCLFLTSCSTTTTTTTVRTDGKQVTTVVEKKVDGNVVSGLSQLVVGGVLTMFKPNPTP